MRGSFSSGLAGIPPTPSNSAAWTFGTKQFVEPEVDVGKWITLSKTEVTLGAHGSEIVPFKIEVPKDEILDIGEHTGGILIQKTDQQKEGQGGLTLLTRVGVRVYVTIPGEIIKKLEIEKFEVQHNPSKKLYTAVLTVKNSGNVSQNVTMTIRVTYLWDWVKNIPILKNFFQDFPVENVRDLQVLRGDSLTSNVEFPQPLFGRLKVEAEVLYDNKAQKLTVDPIYVDVPIDRSIIIICVLFIAFLVSLFALIILKRRNKEDDKKQKLSGKHKPPVKKSSR